MTHRIFNGKIARNLAAVLALALAGTACEYATVDKTAAETETKAPVKTESEGIEIASADSIKSLESRITELQERIVAEDEAETQALRDEVARLQKDLVDLRNRPVAEADPVSSPVTPEAEEDESEGAPPAEGTPLVAVPAMQWTPPTAAAYVIPLQQKVVGLKLVLQTGGGIHKDFDAGRDGSGKVMFDLCKTENFNDANTCFRAKFSDQDPAYLTLDEKAFEAIDFGQYPQVIDVSRKALADLVYPDDFKFFRLASDPKNTIHDAWFVQGVEIQVKLEGEQSFKPVYRNPCVGRWIEEEDSENLYSPHSIENDDAFCVYIETGAGSNAGADDVTLTARVPMDAGQSLDQSTVSWITAYKPGEAPTVFEKNGEVVVPLNYAHRDDYGASDDDQNGDSYTVTVYNGMHRMQENKIRIQTDGTDGVLLHRVRAYHFKPGSKEYLQDGKCLFSQTEPNQWLETDDTRQENWPLAGYQTLSDSTCPELRDIRMDACDFAFGVHTDEWPDLNCSY